MKEFLSEKNIKFGYVDICTSMMSLKRFLKIRDTSEVHQAARDRHSVGIPCMLVDDQVFITETIEAVEQLIQDGRLE